MVYVPPDSFQVALNEIAALNGQFEAFFDMGFLVFSRVIAFISTAPLFGRKDIPFNIKISVAIALSILFTLLHPPHPPSFENNATIYFILLMMNGLVGYVIGFIANTILTTISSSGSIMNNQIGLSSAMAMDPGTKQQTTILENLFSFIGLVTFFHVGGLYWILDALFRSFEIFPLYVIQQDIIGEINYQYLIRITGNTLAIAVQLVAPVMMLTLAIDLVLGIVNRTAQQIQVFQLSFGLKPSVGTAALLVTLPFFFKVVQDFLMDYAQFY